MAKDCINDYATGHDVGQGREWLWDRNLKFMSKMHCIDLDDGLLGKGFSMF